MKFKIQNNSLITEGNVDFYNGEYWNIDLLKKVGLINSLEYFSRILHELKNVKIEDSSEINFEELYKSLQVECNNLNKSLTKIGSML